jgi:predicted short-subunit dehydrogenase-like oxidoreductase (DUF2520 family)
MSITATDSSCAPDRVSVVGGGRLGGAVAEALDAAGIDVLGPFGRAELPAEADAVILCVPDSEIAVAARAAAGAAPLVGHTSGATPLSVIPGPPAAFGLHPLQTFAGGEPPERFRGAGCAIAGSTPAALRCASTLAEALGMQPFVLADEDRAAYHAAASIASNFLLALQAAAEEVAAGAGMAPDHARSMLAPLVRSTVANWEAHGPQRALTGPLVRGDEATVAAQREAVECVAPHLLPLFEALVERTRALAGAEVAA